MDQNLFLKFDKYIYKLSVKQSSLSRFFKPRSPAKTSGPQTSNPQNIASISITKFLSAGLFDYIPKSFSLHIIEFLMYIDVTISFDNEIFGSDILIS
ncbi:hypothetical protein BpHYR1_019182 [Brachionus plicatilis]|uniref:Uncharacterized protein n=1 Tax=Brachionus plicatilis TaxID=10195 RepID=A0A3M7QRN0_BRAPC|nr:hypothetical protein BpHYR1_019182 [Brachionus plicatilis]